MKHKVNNGTDENALLKSVITSAPAQEWTKKRYVNAKLIIGAKIGFIVLLLAAIYYPTASWMGIRWFKADSYYSHGPLIPLVSGVLLWLKRRELAETRISSSRLGLFILSAGLLLHILSALMLIQSISAFSLPIVIIGLVLYLFGWEVTRVVLFPLGFLFFMAPAPMQLVAATTLKMKLFAAHIATIAVQLLDIPLVREGSTVHLSNTTLVVGDPCSGLRSLISLTALGVLYAYFAKTSYPKRIALVLASIPIAIIANIIRVIGVIVVANFYGNRIVTDGLLHDAFGFSVFVIALAGLILVGRILGCQMFKKDT